MKCVDVRRGDVGGTGSAGGVPQCQGCVRAHEGHFHISYGGGAAAAARRGAHGGVT